MTSFVDIEVLYKTIRAQLERGEITQEQFNAKAAELMCQDETGRWWTVHPESGMWHHRWKDEWRPGVPPGHTPAVVKRVVIPSQSAEALERSSQKPPAAPPAEKKQRLRRAAPRWLFPALAATVLVAAVVALVFLVVLPALNGKEAQPIETPQVSSPLAMATFTAVPTAPTTPEATAALEVATEQEPPPTQPPLPEGPDAAGRRPQGPVVLTDDFSDPTSGWSRGIGEGVVVDYRNAALQIELQGGGRSGWSRYEPQAFPNGWFEVTVRGLGAAQGGAIAMAGIAVDVVDDYYGIVFRIDNTGRYAIGRTLPLDMPLAVDWTPSEHIHVGGEPNRLAVLVDREQTAFFVNGWLVYSDVAIRDAGSVGGLVALWGGSVQGFVAPIVFDDVLVISGPDLVIGNGDAVETAATPTSGPTVAVPVPVTLESGEPISPTVETGAAPTPATALPPLDFVVNYVTWYPGSGENWIARFRVEAQGGDGDYVFFAAGAHYESGLFDLAWPCGSPLTAEITVESGDGQQVSKIVWIAAVSCE